MRNTTLVIGCGRLGGSIATYASAQGESVIVIDEDKDSFARLSDIFSGITQVCDATDMESLDDLGIDKVREVVITTGDDNVNLFLAHLFAEVYEVPYIYVRFDDPDKGLLIQGMPIKAIYPFQLSMDRFNVLKSGLSSK